MGGNMKFIGIDLGTSSVKLLLMNEAGEILNSVSREYPISFPKPGWSEQNPIDWYNETIKGIKDLIKGVDKASIKGLSFGGQMHGLVILDEKDEVIRPAILWNDGRTIKECEYLNNEIGKDKLSEYTANIAFAGFTAPKILWLKNNEKESYDSKVTTRIERGEKFHHGRVMFQVQCLARRAQQHQGEEQESHTKEEITHVAVPLAVEQQHTDEEGRVDHHGKVHGVTQGHDPCGEGGSDVGTHNHADGLGQGEQTGRDEGYRHDGGGRRRLHRTGHEGTGEHTREAVGSHLT